MRLSAAVLVGIIIGAIGSGLLMSQLYAPTRGPATVANYEPTTDSQLISVGILVGRLDSIGSSGVQEDAESVRIDVRLLHWRGTAPADLLLIYVPIHLNQPLGGRTVLDAEGKPVQLRL